MLDIEHVNGILIAPDGSYRSFGIHSDAPTSEMTDVNFHDSAFKMELSKDPWFQKVEQDFNIVYTDDTIHRQGMYWASKGIILMIHAGAKPEDAYCILSPSHMSSKQKNLFENNYLNLQNQIIKKNTYFEAYIFDKSGNYEDNGMIYGLDLFYERMKLTEKTPVTRHYR